MNTENNSRDAYWLFVAALCAIVICVGAYPSPLSAVCLIAAYSWLAAVVYDIVETKMWTLLLKVKKIEN